LDNHDFPRMVSRFGNDTAYHNESTKLFATLLLSLRGTPCIYQGSEIGMTNVKFDDLHLYKDIEIKNKIEEWEAEGKDLGDLKAVIHHMARDNARTPMQWNGKFNSGFSSGEPWISVNPNFLTINVEKAKSDINSCWYYYQNLLRIRKIHKTLIYGYYEEFMSTSEAVYIYKRWDEDNTYLILLNFTNEVQKLIGVCYCDKGKLLVSNYSSRHENLLQPWEASIYKLR
jgi:oligo-1,6-glucosidase